MKIMKKVFAVMMCACMFLLSGCGKSEMVKMGVLVSDATTPEALSFKKYYTEYIQKQYNVEFVYSDELKDASGEKSAIDNFITNNCKAVISFSSFDRQAQIDQCSKAKVYYAVATGTLTNEEYEKNKANEYYVGAIGPDLEIEYQAGYDMAKHYLDQGLTKYAIFGGAIPYYTEMHIYRAAGMLTAMCEVGHGTYKGANTKEAIVGTIFKDGKLDTGKIGSVELLGYIGGYDMDDAFFGKCSEMSQLKGLEAILAVGNGSDFFAASKGKDVKIASVDAYAETYGEALKSGSLDYLAGKFSASIGPIFIATLRAVEGNPVRDSQNSLALSQGYWVATSYDQFEEYYKVDSSVEAPAYSKAALDTIKDADFETFKKFVSQYSFEDIQKLSK